MMKSPPPPDLFVSLTDRGADLSIPLDFDGPQPNLYGVPKASRSVLVTSGFTGSVDAGGSCNVDALRLIPHCNGTHTECVGHITSERITLTDCWQPRMLTALLVTIFEFPISEAAVAEAVQPWLGGDSRLGGAARPNALIIRALPKGANPIATYGAAEPAPGTSLAPRPIPFFLPEATAWMREHGFLHLLTDLPSLDPLDSAELLAHRAFWGIAVDEFELSPNAPDRIPDPRTQTVTELIRVPGNLLDGPGILELHVAPFDLDAAPSRPVFHPFPAL